VAAPHREPAAIISADSRPSAGRRRRRLRRVARNDDHSTRKRYAPNRAIGSSGPSPSALDAASGSDLPPAFRARSFTARGNLVALASQRLRRSSSSASLAQPTRLRAGASRPPSPQPLRLGSPDRRGAASDADSEAPSAASFTPLSFGLVASLLGNAPTSSIEAQSFVFPMESRRWFSPCTRTFCGTLLAV